MTSCGGRRRGGGGNRLATTVLPPGCEEILATGYSRLRPDFRRRTPAVAGPRTAIGGAPGGVIGRRCLSRRRGDAGARSPFPSN